MIKGAKTVAEYAIRKWLEKEGFVMEYFKLEFTGMHEAIVLDWNGDSLRLEYDPETRMVLPVE